MKYQHIAMQFFFFLGWSAESIGYNTGDGKLYKGKAASYTSTKTKEVEHLPWGGGEGGAIFLFMLRIKANLAHSH
jgi:hypothetical protein